MTTAAMIKSLPKDIPVPTMADFLMGDHVDTVVLLKHFEKASSSGDRQLMETLTDAIALVCRLHSQAEMDVLYPFVEKSLGADGKQLVKESLEEHTNVEQEALQALELRKSGGDDLASVLSELNSDFTEHLMKEENDIMMKLLNDVSEADMADIAIKFQQAKESAPLEPPAEMAA
jgi:iron-sulfur cluster repair protein YtfE (RIC family)